MPVLAPLHTDTTNLPHLLSGVLQISRVQARYDDSRVFPHPNLSILLPHIRSLMAMLSSAVDYVSEFISSTKIAACPVRDR